MLAAAKKVRLMNPLLDRCWGRESGLSYHTPRRNQCDPTSSRPSRSTVPHCNAKGNPGGTTRTGWLTWSGSENHHELKGKSGVSSLCARKVTVFGAA